MYTVVKGTTFAGENIEKWPDEEKA